MELLFILLVLLAYVIGSLLWYGLVVFKRTWRDRPSKWAIVVDIFFYPPAMLVAYIQWSTQ